MSEDVPEDGYDAHRAGHAMSACPWVPGDPAGHVWRHDWLNAEAIAKADAGTYGKTDDEYRAAGLKPPERDRYGRPFTPRSWEEEAAEQFRALLTRAARAQYSAGMAYTFQPALTVEPKPKPKPEPEPIADVAERWMVAKYPPAPKVVWRAGGTYAGPPMPVGSCLIHGPTAGGLCRACVRGMTA